LAQEVSSKNPINIHLEKQDFKNSANSSETAGQKLIKIQKYYRAMDFSKRVTRVKIVKRNWSNLMTGTSASLAAATFGRKGVLKEKEN
jgi:hypothetical protein